MLRVDIGKTDDLTLNELFDRCVRKVAMIEDLFVNGDVEFTEQGNTGFFYFLQELRDDLSFISDNGEIIERKKEKDKEDESAGGEEVG
jgi:hypothetical protein